MNGDRNELSTVGQTSGGRIGIRIANSHRSMVYITAKVSLAASRRSRDAYQLPGRRLRTNS